MPTLPRQPLTSDTPRGGVILDGAVTAKDKLKAAVDRLTEAEAANAKIVVRRDGDSWLDSLPIEDEEISPEEEAAVQEARDELAAGAPTISHEEIKREFDIK